MKPPVVIHLGGRDRSIRNEADVKDLVKLTITHFNGFWIMPKPMGPGTNGHHDFGTVAILGVPIFTIETKFGSRKPTPDQESIAHELNRRGHKCFLIDENNIERLYGYIVWMKGVHPTQIPDEAPVQKPGSPWWE